MTDPVPSPSVGPLDPETRSAIRRRAGALRRRRWYTSGAGVAVVAAATTAGIVMQGGSAARVVTGSSGVTASCPAASAKVPVRVGENVTFKVLPKGFSLVGGDTADPADYPIVYEQYSPANQPSPGLLAPPSLTLLQNPALVATTPLTSHVSVDGKAATLTAMPNQPAGSTLSWSPAPGVTLVLDAIDVSRSELLAAAAGVQFYPGVVKYLPAKPVADVTAAQAQRAVHPAPGAVVHAALSSWAEIERLSEPQKAPSASVDYRPAWLVYTTNQDGQTSWAAVDAHDGAVLDRASAKDAGWVSAVTDRSKPGCEPPLGVLTATEIAQVDFGAPGLPSGYSLALAWRAVAVQVVGSQTCQVSCTDPLAWVADTAPPVTAESFDALTGQEEAASVGGNTPLGARLGAGLVPGPTPISSSASPTPPPTSASPAIQPPPDPTANPAPAGNGNGPGGLCNGTEKVPPCGPGAVVGQAYPYTLPLQCDGDVIFDGRMWRLTLLPSSDLPPIHVWMTLTGPTGAGWQSPDGSVGLAPMPAGPAPTCGSQ